LSKLPTVSGKNLYKILEKIGYFKDHQTGNHIILRNEKPPYRRLTVPDRKEIAKRHFKKYYKTSRINNEEV